MCAAMYAGRAMLKAVVLERGFPGGELLNTEMIEDYPGFEHILGHELAQKFADHATKFGAEFRTGVMVERVRRRDDKTFEVTSDAGDVYYAPRSATRHAILPRLACSCSLASGRIPGSSRTTSTTTRWDTCGPMRTCRRAWAGCSPLGTCGRSSRAR